MISVKLDSIPLHPNILKRIITNAIYYHYYDIWSSLFGKNFLIINSSRLGEDPGKVMREVQEFLGIESEITEESFNFDEERGIYVLKSDDKPELRGKGRSIGMKLSDVLDKKLKQFYKPFNEKLSSISNISFDWD